MSSKGSVKLPSGKEVAELEEVLGRAASLLESNGMSSISKSTNETKFVAMTSKRN